MTRLIDVLHPRIASFQTPSFSLGEDLDWLDRMRGLEAPVGAILHCARIVEVLSRHAGEQAKLAPKGDSLREALNLLMDNGMISAAAKQLLDELRNSGNNARHAKRRMNFKDAEQCYAVALRGVHWYFCEFSKGPKLKYLCINNQPLDTLLPTEIALLLKMLESDEMDKHGFLVMLGLQKENCPILASPILVCVLIERLLNSGRTDEAQTVLTAARERFPDDVRLRQLQGLYLSRTKRLEEGCAWLEAIEMTDSAIDEETQGILAGIYKRLAAAQPHKHDEWLRASHKKYLRGWQRSRETNTYLGINAATTALWLKRSELIKPIATHIRDILQARSNSLANADGDGPHFLNMWDQLTLAEAYLLLQDADAARQAYADAAKRFATQTGAIEVAKEQAIKILIAMKREDLISIIFP